MSQERKRRVEWQLSRGGNDDQLRFVLRLYGLVAMDGRRDVEVTIIDLAAGIAEADAGVLANLTRWAASYFPFLGCARPMSGRRFLSTRSGMADSWQRHTRDPMAPGDVFPVLPARPRLGEHTRPPAPLRAACLQGLLGGFFACGLARGACSESTGIAPAPGACLPVAGPTVALDKITRPPKACLLQSPA